LAYKGVCDPQRLAPKHPMQAALIRSPGWG
jgi:hypothetical protein